ncbi:MAG: ATP-binding protein [Leptolyngbyaceae cyanobacterium]
MPVTSLLAKIQAILNQEQTLKILLSQCVDAIEQNLDVTALHLWTFNQQNQLLELCCQSGGVASTPLFPERVPLGLSIIGLTAQNKIPYVTEKLGQWQSACVIPVDRISQDSFQSFAVYPLLAANQLVGALALFSPKILTEEIQQSLSLALSMVGYAIAYHQSQMALQSRQDTVLHRVASQMQDTLDLDTILSVAVQEIRDIFHIDRCNFIWCWSSEEMDDNGHQLPPMIAITHEAKRSHIQSLLGDCSPQQTEVLAQKILTLEEIQVTQVDQTDHLDADTLNLLKDWDLTACFLYPLETHLGQLGAIVCGQIHEPRVWTEVECELIRAIAGQLASAINQAELYAQTKASAFAAQTQAHQLTQTLENLQQTQAQLIQSEKMSSLGQLVAGIAHEINNPVSFISGNVHYAQTYFHDLMTLISAYQKHYPNPNPELQALIEDIDLEFLVEDLEKLLQSMDMGSERIRQIVLSLRNFSRLDEAEVKQVNIHEGLENTLLILQNRLKSKNSKPPIEVIKFYDDLPLVRCYAGPLNQVFMNLLSNAIDALEDQETCRQIRVKTTRSFMMIGSEKVDSVKISVADNGPGIAPENLSRLFDPFFTTKEIGKGTGLGLAVSYQIVVERHQGLFNCVSAEGEGAEFIVEIPLSLGR